MIESHLPLEGCFQEPESFRDASRVPRLGMISPANKHKWANSQR